MFGPEDEAARSDRIRAFIETTPWRGRETVPLQMDSSVRRFMRVRKDGHSAILMDARPPMDDVGSFQFIRNKFAALGCSVPEIYALDPDQSLALMEDFGDERFYEIVQRGGQDVEQIYALATDVLVQVYHADPAMALAESVPYQHEYWTGRVARFVNDYCRHAAIPTATIEDEYTALFHDAIGKLGRFDPVLLFGDFASQNLYYKPDRDGIRAIGEIDFQDATPARGNMSGSPAFDLAFLLSDPRVPAFNDMEERMKQRYLNGTGLKDAEGFEQDYAIISAALAAKCLGLYACLGHDNGRGEYLEFIPKCWANLEQSLVHPALKELREWFDTHIPYQKRYSVNAGKF